MAVEIPLREPGREHELEFTHARRTQPESRPVKIAAVTFAAGIAILAVVGVLTLNQAPPRLVRIGAPGVKATNAFGVTLVASTIGSATACQSGEVLPAGVSAIRVSIWAFFGARVRVSAYQGSRLLTQGERGSDWTSDSVTVPVHPLDRAHSDVKLCVAAGPNSEPLLLLGPSTPQREGVIMSEALTPPARLNTSVGRRLSGRVTIEYLAPGQGSWWSRILPVARRLGLGRAYSGTWIALLLALLTGAMCVLAVRLGLKELQ